MWSRTDKPSFGNSAFLKYRILFTTDKNPIYDTLVIGYYRSEKSWLGLQIILHDHSIHDNLETALAGYEITSWKGKEKSWINVSCLNKDSCKTVFDIINKLMPTNLSKSDYAAAVDDIQNYVVPTEKSVPWGSSVTLFSSEVSKLEQDVVAKMYKNGVSKGK